jgi:phage terminase Nu1 subunit (DNA packaging protein)
MQFEISTAEAAELFSVTKKTIALWSQHGVMVKLRHGVYDLKLSLQNWASYQQAIFQGADDPLTIWRIRQEVEWSEARRPQNVGVSELIPLETAKLRVNAQYDENAR